VLKGIDYIGIGVMYFCHDGEGNFVMAKRGSNARDEQGRWDIGGGGIEFGHTVEQTLRKEITEEYCTDVLDYEFLGYRDVLRTHDGKPTHWLALDFKVLVDRNKVKNGEPHKFDDIGWFTFDTIPRDTHSEMPRFFKVYADKLK
jgi:8-oxo-dGTP pyrophosphatase MutT (NUDIX family)